MYKFAGYTVNPFWIGLFVDGVTIPRHQSDGTNPGLMETY